ncbi:MAG TPA: hypothetical protein GX697_05630, partial [Firmicutes bacterium]|nr:hypothetical protein [Bacillota bacterium]
MSKQRIIYLISTLSILLLFSSFMPAGFPPSVIPDTRGQGLPANIKDKGLPALPEKALANNLPEDVSSEAASPQEVLPPSAD